MLPETGYRTDLLKYHVEESSHENAILASLVASRKNYLRVKRLFDVVVSSILIITILSWLTPLLALLIRFGTKGPIFFIQRRVGLNGVVFRCYKFRTMVVNEFADERPAEEDDPRITRLGRFLRQTKIDELPQLLNVLTGAMSLTGPRPHMISDCTRFSFVIASYEFRTLVKPGITGLAQVKGYRGPAGDYESILNRYYWDAEYVRRAGLKLDMMIIGETVVHAFTNIGKQLTSVKNKSNHKLAE